MARQPHKHHCVPKFHLAGFTETGEVDGKLFVTDKNLRRIWQTTPRKAARETDFYQVEIDSMDPMGVEKAFADLEGECATVIRSVIASNTLPTGTDFEVLLNFVAMSATRVPMVRSIISDFIDRLVKQLGASAFLGPNGAKRLREYSVSSGMPISDAEIQGLQDVITGDEYTVDYERNWHIQTMLEATQMLRPLLAKRHWYLWTVGADVPDLVCSDRPVALCSFGNGLGVLPPGFGTPNTLLTIPLSRRVLLASQFEEMPSDSYIMDSEDVSAMNLLRALYAKQVYSAQKDWIWNTEDLTVGAQAYLDSLVDDRSNPDDP